MVTFLKVWVGVEIDGCRPVDRAAVAARPDRARLARLAPRALALAQVGHGRLKARDGAS